MESGIRFEIVGCVWSAAGAAAATGGRARRLATRDARLRPDVHSQPDAYFSIAVEHSMSYLSNVVGSRISNRFYML